MWPCLALLCLSFLAYKMEIILVHVLCLVVQSCLTLCDPMDYSPPGSSVHGDSPDKNTRVGSLFLLQEIFPTQESNPGISCIAALQLSCQGCWKTQIILPFFGKSFEESLTIFVMDYIFKDTISSEKRNNVCFPSNNAYRQLYKFWVSQVQSSCSVIQPIAWALQAGSFQVAL